MGPSSNSSDTVLFVNQACCYHRKKNFLEARLNRTILLQEFEIWLKVTKRRSAHLNPHCVILSLHRPNRWGTNGLVEVQQVRNSVLRQTFIYLSIDYPNIQLIICVFYCEQKEVILIYQQPILNTYHG
jgi:hypothetical protein